MHPGDWPREECYSGVVSKVSKDACHLSRWISNQLHGLMTCEKCLLVRTAYVISCGDIRGKSAMLNAYTYIHYTS